VIALKCAVPSCEDVVQPPPPRCAHPVVVRQPGQEFGVCQGCDAVLDGSQPEEDDGLVRVLVRPAIEAGKLPGTVGGRVGLCLMHRAEFAELGWLAPDEVRPQ
jgi:hypothetical protein